MSKKILIIEDDLEIANLERDYLEIEGYEVAIKHDGINAEQMIANNTFSLVVLDIMLPGRDGFDILKSIRATCDVPILLVTAKVDDIDKIRGLGLGADDYIVKPFSPSELVARVNAHISRYERLVNKTAKESVLNVRGLSINDTARRVTFYDTPIQLTTTEYELLYFLASNPDHVFSKRHILDRIWGHDYFGDGTTVTVHISKLRDKIDKSSLNKDAHNYIETVWGAGYRFNY